MIEYNTIVGGENYEIRFKTDNKEEMRFLTPEENERKIKMYKKMSTVVSGVNFFD